MNFARIFDENDTAEVGEANPSLETVREIHKHLNEKKEKLIDNMNTIEANGGKEISTVDTDAHLMYTNGDG
jgi:hypothetical protein